MSKTHYWFTHNPEGLCKFIDERPNIEVLGITHSYSSCDHTFYIFFKYKEPTVKLKDISNGNDSNLCK